MSPASSGPLEVERYIGACLISSQHRTKTGIVNAHSPGNFPRERYLHQDVYNSSYPVNIDRFRPRRCNSDGWAGGMPLISFANNHRRNRRPEIPDTRSSSPRIIDDPVTPLSRLAVHTQGVPLILSGRHNNRRNKPTTRVVTQGRADPAKKDSTRAVDSLSVASDESSGSNNSETSLPRIIKPRKRRKKDRKPHGTRPPSVEECSGTSPNIVTLKPYVVPYCFTRDRVFPPRYINTFSETDSERRVSVTDSELSEAPQLHHRFEDVVGLDSEIDQPSSCQCRYCDPAGQIWDVDRHCYSPFLTSPAFRHDPLDQALARRHLAEKISTALENKCLISTFTTDSESSSSDDTTKEAEVKSRSPAQCLDISTEIVTSPNGHRDLEIRLFSTPAPGSKKSGARDSKAYSAKCSSASERLCSVSDDCSLQPEE